jgi:hypothetical protein
METCVYWGVTPFQYAALPEMEQAIMLVHWREHRLRKAHLDKVQSDVMDKKSNNSSNNNAPSDHDRFFGG